MRSPDCRTGCSSSICSSAPSSEPSAIPITSLPLLVLGLDRFKVVNQSLGVLERRSPARFGGATAPDEPARNRRRLARRRADSRWRASAETSSWCCSTTSPTRATPSESPSVFARRLRTPFDVEGHQVFTSAVVGITVSTTGYERPEQVLQDAAIALHRAKSRQHGGLRTLRPSHARARDDPPAARDRPAECHRQRGDHRSLPAHHLARHRHHQGLRGARALAPSRRAARSARRNSFRSPKTPA